VRQGRNDTSTNSDDGDWRAIEDLTGSAWGLPAAESAPGVPWLEPVSRRRALQLLGGSFALGGLGACSGPPPESIVAQAIGPETGIPAPARTYATARVLDGYATGIHVRCYGGRPSKIEGNPHHPDSLGGTDPFAEALVLELWDPDRSQIPLRSGAPASWEALESILAERATGWGHGAGLRILTGMVTSPSLIARLDSLCKRYPNARWHRYQALGNEWAHAGSRLAFGEVYLPRYGFDRARVIVCLDVDPFSTPPAHLACARGYAAGRAATPAEPRMNRLYVAEPTPTLAGAMADHRLAVRRDGVDALTRWLAARLGVIADAGAEAVSGGGWLGAVEADLREARGAGLVLAGPGQPPAVHALVHALNERLGNAGKTVHYLRPPWPLDTRPFAELRALASDLQRGRVDTLLILEGNPVYDAPADVDFAAALAHAGLSVHLGLYADETAERCDWHAPAAHTLESWGDARGSDGTISIVQPAIRPLYDGRTALELLALVDGASARDGHELVRGYWQGRETDREQGFDALWHRTLAMGVLPDSAAPLVHPEVSPGLAERLPPHGHRGTSTAELVFTPDARTHDGRYANNAWLQELPRPISQLTWDNAALVSPALARRRGLNDGDIVLLRHEGRETEAPVWIMPGQAEDSVSLSLGCGRRRGGQVAAGAGVDAYRLRTTSTPWSGTGLELSATGRRRALASTQRHQSMEGRDFVRVADLARFRTEPGFARQRRPGDSLYPEYPAGRYAWAMSIDLNVCIGCKACTIACQAENNIPVVGREEVLRGRQMHWIRVDRYYHGAPEHPRYYFQPVPCMHCEHAPCELVCPVGATIHDHEGLNLQVYNRCVGTRFCSNNCPYKVRRFNFLQYAKRGLPQLAAQKNPDVTVRRRGVMEKCTYCLQRIARARIEAELQDRRIRDGEVVAACQAACPTRAIVFGDGGDADTLVSQAKRSPRNYAILTELNTRPRTSYLARLYNPREGKD
jgi:Fe-S-cluster-containing dehydrogenase component/anaerobic selenocysteine-containing dehydrogenase